jgi:hypothetical protein
MIELALALAIGLLMGLGLTRVDRWLRSTPPAEEAERIVDTPKEPATGDPVAPLFGWVGIVFIVVAVPLGILYFLVRFVKWAWVD